MFVCRLLFAISITFTIRLLEGSSGWRHPFVAWVKHWFIVIVGREELTQRGIRPTNRFETCLLPLRRCWGCQLLRTFGAGLVESPRNRGWEHISSKIKFWIRLEHWSFVSPLNFRTGALVSSTARAFRGVVPRGSSFRHRQRNVNITDIRRRRKTMHRPGPVSSPGATARSGTNTSRRGRVYRGWTSPSGTSSVAVLLIVIEPVLLPLLTLVDGTRIVP